MNKILLVYEDYTDLMNTEASLKKIGFDVIGVTNEFSLSDQVISFNPDVVVACGRGGRVTPANVGKKLKEMIRWNGKAILIFSNNAKPTAQDLIKIRADMVLEAPVPGIRLIQVLAKLLNHDETLLLERLNKSTHIEPVQGQTFTTVSGNKVATPNRFYVSGASEDQPQKESSSLFGNIKNAKDLYQESRPETESSTTENTFSDVDLKDLERELSGYLASTTTGNKQNLSFKLDDREAPFEDSALQALMPEELKNAEKSVSKKIAKYSQMTKSIEIPAISTVRRVEARKRQREMVKDWDQKNIKEIDELRRQFTKAMFKK